MLLLLLRGRDPLHLEKVDEAVFEFKEAGLKLDAGWPRTFALFFIGRKM